MKNLLAFLFCAFCLSFAVSAQSGRRVQPTPTPAVKEDTPDDYSESKPNPKRLIAAPQFRVGASSTGSTDAGSNAGVQTSADDDDVVKVATDLVTIPVSVFDRNGLYIPNLRQSDFKIFQEGKEQDIAYFGTSDKPFTVVLLIDVSPSTAYKIEEIQRAAKAFVNQLKEQDRVMVVDFDSRVHVLTEPTTDRQEIDNAIRKTRFGDGTSLYEAVSFSIRKRLNGIEGRKAIVLFTDGVDTTSNPRKANYDSTLDDAEEADALIFPIYYNTFSDMNGSINSPFPGGGMGIPGIGGGTARGESAAAYAVGRKYLEELANYTGGRVFRPEATPGGLTAAFEGIAEELRRQYNIGFIPKDEAKPGQKKQIKVRVNMPNVIVRSRDSYVVGAQAKTAVPTPKTK
ncbi:MAG: VWA domain-containing protein [Acidobacteriota bacterium]